MTSDAATYDLMLLLDPQAEEARRTKLVSDASAAIKKDGELLRHDRWGERQLAYHIRRKTSAEYHLLQFHASRPELLGELDRSLRIADEVLRFRLIKLRPGVPDAPDAQAGAPAAGRGTNGSERGTNGSERGAPAEARSGAPEAAGEAATAATSGEAEGDNGAAG
jgi:small subunit ribosomal protein S6